MLGFVMGLPWIVVDDGVAGGQAGTKADQRVRRRVKANGGVGAAWWDGWPVVRRFPAGSRV